MTCKLLYLSQTFPCSTRDNVNIEQILQCGWTASDIIILHSCPHAKSMYSDITHHGIYEIVIPVHANTKTFWDHAWKYLPQYIPAHSRCIPLSWFDDQHGLFTREMFHQIQAHPLGRIDIAPNIVRHVLRIPS